jgi:hypothetical protein
VASLTSTHRRAQTATSTKVKAATTQAKLALLQKVLTEIGSLDPDLIIAMWQWWSEKPQIEHRLAMADQTPEQLVKALRIVARFFDQVDPEYTIARMAAEQRAIRDGTLTNRAWLIEHQATESVSYQDAKEAVMEALYS